MLRAMECKGSGYFLDRDIRNGHGRADPAVDTLSAVPSHYRALWFCRCHAEREAWSSYTEKGTRSTGALYFNEVAEGAFELVGKLECAIAAKARTGQAEQERAQPNGDGQCLTTLF
jgi:hypothetical protein